MQAPVQVGGFGEVVHCYGEAGAAVGGPGRHGGGLGMFVSGVVGKLVFWEELLALLLRRMSAFQFMSRSRRLVCPRAGEVNDDIEQPHSRRWRSHLRLLCGEAATTLGELQPLTGPTDIRLTDDGSGVYTRLMPLLN